MTEMTKVVVKRRARPRPAGSCTERWALWALGNGQWLKTGQRMAGNWQRQGQGC